MRIGVVRGVAMRAFGNAVLEVYEPDTSMKIEIRHGFSKARGANLHEKRTALYGREIFFDREETPDGAMAAYVFKGFVKDDL